MNHELHFKMNEKALNKLITVSQELKIRTISKTIVVIFTKLLPYLEKNQIEFQNRKSNYKLIADPNEKRRSVHTYIPEKMYRKLKELHQYSNFYSLAQIIREIIEIFIKDFFIYGKEKMIKKFNKLKKDWIIKKVMQKGKEFLRQLSNKNTIAPALTIKYDSEYQPFSIKFHNISKK